MDTVKIGNRKIGKGNKTYIIADVGSNFDGSKQRAKLLIDLVKECGADAVKFQAFEADKIISKQGFEGLKADFQKKWEKPVYETYKEAELPRAWIKELMDYAAGRGLDFLCTPYDRAAVDILDEAGVPAFKIGSGDLNWYDFLEYVAGKNKPIILSAGASDLPEIEEAIKTIKSAGNGEIILLQCITGYPSKFESSNIKAMAAMGELFDVQVGYSDHTPGYAVPLGAVSLGGCVIEKHFTDDKNRKGPDHKFALNTAEFKEMVDNIRLLEKALGSDKKQVCEEEKMTVILQRRCLRAARDIEEGTILEKDMIDVLRPAPENTLEPKYKKEIIGKELKSKITRGDPFTLDLLK